MASLERAVVLLYRRHFEHYVLDVTVVRAEAALERAGLARRRPDRPPAIAFLDLSGYTKLTEERGDRAAAELAARLVEIVHEPGPRHGGRPVKLLGDGVMFHFPEPAQAVRCGLELVDRIPGSACRRPGSACTAARWSSRTATTSAAPSTSRPGSPTTPSAGEILVSDQVVADVDRMEAVRFEPVGPVSLKGLSAPITLFTAVHAG